MIVQKVQELDNQQESSEQENPQRPSLKGSRVQAIGTRSGNCLLYNERRNFIKYKNISYDKLYDLYIIQELTQRQIGQILGVSQTQVRRELQKNHIPTRTTKESRQTGRGKKRTKELAEYYKEKYTIWRENVCEYCGKTFIVDGEHKRKKYCSNKFLLYFIVLYICHR